MSIIERILALPRWEPKAWNEWMMTETPDGEYLDRDAVLAIVREETARHSPDESCPSCSRPWGHEVWCPEK